MSADSDWAEANTVPVWESTATPRAAKITGVAKLNEFDNSGFLVSLEDVVEPYTITMDRWIALGAGIGGYLIFRADADVTYQTAANWEEDHSLVVP